MYILVALFKRLSPEQNGHHFADNISKLTFFNENICISIQFSLNFVLTGSVDNSYVYVW